MSNEKEITLSFDLGQVANDILEKCNLISQSIRDEAMEDIKANVMEPDNPETRSIINRALTEAFGEVKVLCQRYLKVGRTTDNNDLERMVRSVTYAKKTITVQDRDESGKFLLFTCTVSGTPMDVYQQNGVWKIDGSGLEVTPDDTPQPKMVLVEVDDTDNPTSITYETILLVLWIPNFNVSVTDSLKSSIHKYVVDYIMSRFLQDQLADKAAEYKALADGEDSQRILRNLNARDRFNMRKPSWV